jgi:hypothetical protein
MLTNIIEGCTSAQESVGLPSSCCPYQARTDMHLFQQLFQITLTIADKINTALMSVMADELQPLNGLKAV